MRIFLAGATGVIGRRVVPLLVAQGHQVTGMTRKAVDADRLRAGGVDAVMADVYDAEALADAVLSARPEVVMHQLTDLGGGDRAANARIRITGTRNLVDAALAAGVRKMVAQSVSWAYEGGEEPATEQTPLDLHGDPSRLGLVTGIAALEEAVAEMPEWLVLRYGLFYGPDTWYRPGGLMAQGGGLAANGDITSFVHVDDAAEAAVEALSWPTGAVNICDDEPAAGHEWVPAFCRSVGAPVPATSKTRANWARGANNHYARKHLNWTPNHPTWRTTFTTP